MCPPLKCPICYQKVNRKQILIKHLRNKNLHKHLQLNESIIRDFVEKAMDGIQDTNTNDINSSISKTIPSFHLEHRSQLVESDEPQGPAADSPPGSTGIVNGILDMENIDGTMQQLVMQINNPHQEMFPDLEVPCLKFLPNC